MENHNSHAMVIEKYAIGFFILLNIVILYPGSLSGIYTYIPQIIVGFVAVYAMLKVKMNIQTRYFLIFGMYMLVMSIFFSIINGTSILLTLRSSLRLFYPFLAIIIGSFFSKKISPKSLLYILLIFLLFESIVSFLQFNNVLFREWSFNIYRSEDTANRYLNSFSFSTGQRAIGTFGNPNTLGLTFVVLNSSIILLSDLLKGKRIKMAINIISILTSIYVIVNTQSRTSILLYVFVIAIIFYWKFSKRGKNNAIFLIVSSIVAVLLFMFIQSNINRDISVSALYSRFDIWGIRISQMFDYVEYEGFFAVVLGGGFQMARSFGFFDNTYLKIFVSGGIIGLLIFFMVINSIYKGIRRIKRVEYRHLAWVLFVTWLIGSMLVEYQEIFKLSTITFILLGYTLYSDKKDNDSIITASRNNNFLGDRI